MNENEPTDHWANLAAELGAQPASVSPVAADSEQQTASAPSSAPASQPETPPRPAGTSSASDPQSAAAPTAATTQTKSNWDILAEQLGISTEQAAEPRQTDAAGATGPASSARKAEGPGDSALGENVGLRPAGGSRPRRQPSTTRFGEGIFDEGPSAEAAHLASAAGEAVEGPRQSAEVPQAQAGAVAAHVADIAGQQLAAQGPAASASAQHPAEHKSGRRRRKKRRSQESAATTKPQPALDASAAASVRHEPEASDAESEPSQDWREQIEADEDWHEPASAEQRATHQTEQVAEAEEARTVESTEVHGAPIEQENRENFVPPPDRLEAPGQPQPAVAESDAADGQAAESPPSAGGESPKHRAIPTWAEAISVIINANLEARARRGDAGRDRRERGGR